MDEQELTAPGPIENDDIVTYFEVTTTTTTTKSASNNVPAGKTPKSVEDKNKSKPVVDADGTEAAEEVEGPEDKVIDKEEKEGEEQDQE